MWSERFPQGVTVQENSDLAKQHPEMFLPQPRKMKVEKKEETGVKTQPEKTKVCMNINRIDIYIYIYIYHLYIYVFLCMCTYSVHNSCNSSSIFKRAFI